MSTSLLYHGFGIIGYLHLRTRYIGGEVEFTIQHTKLRCSLCNSPKIIRRGTILRSFKALPNRQEASSNKAERSMS